MFSYLILFAALIPILLWGFWTFDKLVRLEYENHRPQWEGDGKPHGFFWIPAESRKSLFARFGSDWSSNMSMFTWLFSTPEWMRADPEAMFLVWRFRTSILIWNAGLIFIWFPAFIFAQP